MADSFGAKLFAKPKTVGAVFTEIAQVVEGDAAKLKKMVSERKNLGQANRYVTKRGTFTDGGSLGLKIVFEKVLATYLKAWFDTPDPYTIAIEFPDDTDDEGNVSRFGSDAVLEELGIPLPAEGGRLEADITLAISGSVTYTESTTATAAG